MDVPDVAQTLDVAEALAADVARHADAADHHRGRAQDALETLYALLPVVSADMVRRFLELLSAAGDRLRPIPTSEAGLRAELDRARMERADAVAERDLLRAAAARGAITLPSTSTSGLPCPICRDTDESPHVALAPCGHLLCEECSGRLREEKCPVCRMPISSTLRLHV